jgi:uroporphyrinogen III methyltransferase/synthase
VTVYLVGAGPGDASLLTLRGLELLRRAQAVVHDRLCPRGLLELAPRDCVFYDVGKVPGGGWSQSEINQLLVSLAKRLERVVRLKGGDPFVLGRGGEEALALSEAGVDFEIVPGVSAATAAPLLAGIPVTHRGISSGFVVLSGKLAEGGEPDWRTIARSGLSIVVLMGVASRGEVAWRLIEAGMSPATPAAAISDASLASERTWRGRLGELAKAPITAPATIVIGEVARLSIKASPRRSLSGKSVVVTRPRGQDQWLAEALQSDGAKVVRLPVIEIGPPADGGAALREAISALHDFEWVVLTSANGVASFFSHLRDARDLGGIKVAAIGPATARALAERGVIADLVPRRYVSEGLLEEFPQPEGRGMVLLARAAGARKVLPEGLRAMGWEVVEVEAYRSVQAPADEEALEAAKGADLVLLASPSAAEAFRMLVGEGFRGQAFCIGPVTAEAARRLGLVVAGEAEVYTAEGLLEALRRWVGERGP